MIESRDPSKTSMLSFESINFQCEFVEHYLKPHIRSHLSDLNSPYEIKFEYLSSMIAKFVKKSDCNALESEDVDNFILTLKHCHVLFQKLLNLNIMIQPNIDQAAELNLSPICIDENLIDSFNYLIEKKYYFKDVPEGKNLSLVQKILQEPIIDYPVVRYASIYISVNKRDAKFLLPFYRYYLEPNFLSKSTLNLNENKNFMIKGLNFEIKQELFEILIWSSLTFILIAVIFVSIIIVIYVKSFIIAFVFLTCNIFSLLESFFIFVLILKIDFLALINVLSFFIVLAVSCNNLFILNDTWFEAKLKYKYLLITKYMIDQRVMKKSMPIKDNQNPRKNIYENNAMLSIFLESSLRYTLKNAVVPLLVINLTIAISFLVNLSSSIIATKLFGIFTAIAIILNFLFLALLVPCFLVMFIKYSSSLDGMLFKLKNYKIDHFNLEDKCIKFKNLIQVIKQYYQNFFEVSLPNFIVSFRYLSILLLTFLAIGGFILLFLSPSLIFQDSTTLFQFFARSNPLEYYEQHFTANSESNGIYLYQSYQKPFLKVNFIFGINTKDSSYHLRSEEYGYLQYDNDFNFYEEQSQIWFDRFCNSLQTLEDKSLFSTENEPFRKISTASESNTTINDEGQKSICLFDLLRNILTRDCPVNVDSNDVVNSVCCGSSFPFDPEVLETCMKNATFLSLFINQNSLYEKIYYNKENGVIKAVEYDQITSSISTTNSAKILEFYDNINEFFKEQLKIAVTYNNSIGENIVTFKQQKGFFVSEFDFFDFKNSLLNGAIKSAFITLAIFFLLTLLSTRNIIVTLSSFFTITFIISTTLGTIALLECELRMIEYLSFISTIGFSINYLMHVSLFYCSVLTSGSSKNCHEANIFFVKENNTKCLIKKVGSAAFMSCLVSLIASFSLTLSSLTYFQTYGIFILVTTFYSLLYSYFLFLPICSIIGPLTNKVECFGTKEKENRCKKNIEPKRIFGKNRRIDESGYTTS